MPNWSPETGSRSASPSWSSSSTEPGMDEPLAVALKFGFLVVLYLFLLWVVRSAMKDLARAGASGSATEPVEPPKPRRRQSAVPDLCAGVQPRLEVVAAMGFQPGTQFDVGH